MTSADEPSSEDAPIDPEEPVIEAGRPTTWAEFAADAAAGQSGAWEQGPQGVFGIELTAMSLSDEDQELVDLEEPVIDGPPPTTAKDFVDDSKDGQAEDSEWTVSSGPAVSGSGWTVELPDG